ncbi:dihydrodipicolinate synthase/N-acetylneuraminate lyase [Bradyrhizobium sp. LB14.3]|uniref:hypothetical protein n=1 Tax=Bradyrhizobium sp. LB14.3 TaxID=3156328 RepID=UPI003395FE9A
MLVDFCLAYVGSRKAVMIACKNFRTQFAIERARYAAARGASLLMLMPPYHGVSLNADAPSRPDRFGRIADAAKIWVPVLNALLSSVTLTMSFLVRLAGEMPRFSYFNIEVPFAAAKPRTLTGAGGEAILGPYDGEEAITMMPHLDAGASGTIPGALLPDLLLPVIDHHTRGHRREAALPVVN